jgi:hypothetical protein
MCGLLGDKTVLKKILNLELKYLGSDEFDLVVGFDWTGVSKHLTHLPVIDFQLIDFLKRYPELVTAKIIQKYGAQWCWKEFNMIFNDTLNMANNLGIVDIMNRIRQCKDLRQLILLHDKFSLEINKKKCSEIDFIEYEKPPIEGNSNIVPIINNHELHKEGGLQKHCVASYHRRVIERTHYIYKILHPERATLSIRLTKVGVYVLDQLYLSCNRKVSAETRAFVLAWINSQMLKPA